MQEGYVELEAFQKMVKALEDYREELTTQKEFLKMQRMCVIWQWEVTRLLRGL